MSNDKVSSEVIEKIRKCLALAHGKGATQGEMEAAMGKAKEIAMRYHLDIADISMESTAKKKSSLVVDKGQVKVRSQHIRPYHRYVCGVLQEIFGIAVIRIGGGRYVFIGEAFDVAVCCELFPWLEESFWGCYWTIRKARGEGEYVAGTANGAYLGFYRGLLEANKRAEKTLTKDESSTWALVVVNKDALVKQRVEEEFPQLSKARANGPRNIDHDAYQKGYAKGRTVTLRQVGGGSTSSAIQG